VYTGGDAPGNETAAAVSIHHHIIIIDITECDC
jgi:hypothetical protein